MVKDSTLQMRISAELKEQAVRIANARGESLSEFIETWLQGEVERHAPCSVCGTWLPLDVLEGSQPWEFECRKCMEELKKSDSMAEQESRAVLWGFKEGYKDGRNRFKYKTPKDSTDAWENVMMWIGYREGYREGREAADCPGRGNDMQSKFLDQATYEDGHSWEETEDRQRVINGWMVWEYCDRCKAQRLVRIFDSGDSRPIWRRDPDPTPDCKVAKTATTLKKNHNLLRGDDMILASNSLQGLTADDRPLQPAQAAILRQLCHPQDIRGRVSRHALYAAADLNDPDPDDNNRGLRRVLGSITQRLNNPDWYSSVEDPTAPGGRWYLLREDLRDELCEILADHENP